MTAGHLGAIGTRMKQTLADAFSPLALDVIDESHKHAGHMGARPEGETHFKVRMTSSAFAGKSRIDRQRAVHKALADLLKERVHALSLDLKAPGEAAKG